MVDVLRLVHKLLRVDIEVLVLLEGVECDFHFALQCLLYTQSP